MCKVCSKCSGLMNYDPYFKAEICTRCGMIERKKTVQKVEYRYVSKQGGKLSLVKKAFIATH